MMVHMRHMGTSGKFAVIAAVVAGLLLVLTGMTLAEPVFVAFLGVLLLAALAAIWQMVVRGRRAALLVVAATSNKSGRQSITQKGRRQRRPFSHSTCVSSATRIARDVSMGSRMRWMRCARCEPTAMLNRLLAITSAIWTPSLRRLSASDARPH